MRKFASLTAALSFVLTLVTSIVLYVTPKGRVAYWADWSLLGLTKEQWGELHLTLGTLFLAALALHVWYNWKPLINYLRDKARSLRFFTAPMNAALAVTVGLTALTFAGLPPASWIVDGNVYFQDAASAKYGEPPYGHAELSSLTTFCRQTGLDLDTALANLAETGITVSDASRTVLSLAKENSLSPKALHAIMRGPDTAPATPVPMPDVPPPGTGRLTVADLATQYGLNIPGTLRALADAGIDAKASDNIRSMAETSIHSPQEIYEIIRKSGGGS